MSYFQFYYEPYIAIIGDIKNSKNITERYQFQQLFHNVINRVNEIYKNDIASNFTITLGDEFQGLLHSGENLMDIILYIKKELYPQKIRIGIGIGTITTNINKDISIGADGPGYHKARESIENLKKMENQREIAFSDIEIRIEEIKKNQLQELALNTIFKLMYSIEQKWTIKQRETILYMLIHHSNQLTTASHFHVSASNIYQIINKGNYYTYKESLTNLNKIMNEVYQYVKF